MREIALAALLLVAAALVVAGVSMWSPAASLVAAGPLLAGWALIVFREAS